MERKFYTNSFEDLLKQRSDEFRMYPSKRVWHSIYNDLHPSRRWPSVAASMLFVFTLLLLGYWNNKSEKIINNSIATNPSNKKNSIADVKNNNGIAQQNNTTSLNNSSKTIPYIFADDLNELASNKNNSLKNNANLSNKENHFANIADILNPVRISQTNVNDVSSNTILVPIEIEKLNKKNEEILIAGNETKLVSSNSKNTLTSITGANEHENSLLANKIEVKQQNTSTTLTTLKDSLDNVNSNNEKAIALSADEKAWIEAYALHNKSKRKKWKDRTTINFYITPSIGYRTLTSDAKYNNITVIPPLAPISVNANVNQSVNQKYGLGLEVGVNFNYTFAKKFRLIAGLQGDITNYAIVADNLNHPVTTNLLIINAETGIPSLTTVSSNLYNSSALQPVVVHSKTYQLSLPVGLAYKIHSYKKMDWFAATTIQPTYVFGGNAYLISADRKNYVHDASAIHQFNLNAGVETYLSYKFDGFSLQVGPQFRYQLYSTYDKKYTIKENLYNVGIKIGIVKNF